VASARPSDKEDVQERYGQDEPTDDSRCVAKAEMEAREIVKRVLQAGFRPYQTFAHAEILEGLWHDSTPLERQEEYGPLIETFFEEGLEYSGYLLDSPSEKEHEHPAQWIKKRLPANWKLTYRVVNSVSDSGMWYHIYVQLWRWIDNRSTVYDFSNDQNVKRNISYLNGRICGALFPENNPALLLPLLMAVDRYDPAAERPDPEVALDVPISGIDMPDNPSPNYSDQVSTWRLATALNPSVPKTPDELRQIARWYAVSRKDNQIAQRYSTNLFRLADAVEAAETKSPGSPINPN
jgi:hypothetical protein